MKELFEVFRMEELSVETRIKVMNILGEALNWEHGSNWTEDIRAELIAILRSRKKPNIDVDALNREKDYSFETRV